MSPTTRKPAATEAAPNRYADLPPKERLLAAAHDLFYREGVHSVGIDRVIDEAGVARGTLYNSYGNKDGLVAAYLHSRHEATSRRLLASLERHHTPRARLLGIFEAQGELFDENFNGCAFVNATAETHDRSADEAAGEFRRWVRDLFTELARDAGARNPAKLGRQLQMIYDGAGLSARMDRDGHAAKAARAAAADLLDAS